MAWFFFSPHGATFSSSAPDGTTSLFTHSLQVIFIKHNVYIVLELNWLHRLVYGLSLGNTVKNGLKKNSDKATFPPSKLAKKTFAADIFSSYFAHLASASQRLQSVTSWFSTGVYIGLLISYEQNNMSILHICLNEYII